MYKHVPTHFWALSLLFIVLEAHRLLLEKHWQSEF